MRLKRILWPRAALVAETSDFALLQQSEEDLVIFTHYWTHSLDVEDSQVTCSRIPNDGLVTPTHSPVTKPKVIRCFAEVFDCSSLPIRISYMFAVYKLPKVIRPHLSALREHDIQSF